MDWVLDHLDHSWASVSLALPLTLDSIALSHWPAFLLDLLPAGPARDRWLALLGIRNGPAADHLQALSARVRALPETARRFQLPDPVFEHCQPRWERLAADLEKTR